MLRASITSRFQKTVIRGSIYTMFQAAWYYFILNLARLAFFLGIGGIRSVGKENVPITGPLIVAPIHVSHLDPPAVACGTNRRLRFMAKEELFRGPLGKLITSLGAFPVKRGEGDTESIRLAMSLLEKGEAVLIFPEGTRGDGTSLQPLNKGVALLAKRTEALVMPVAVVGTHVAWPRGQKQIRRQRLTIAYGIPRTYRELATDENGKESRDLFTTRLAEELIALSRANGLSLAVSA
ncbi:MAG: lysophospholipid acyltransferase family protein [Fimbriimonadaceae bacterium]